MFDSDEYIKKLSSQYDKDTDPTVFSTQLSYLTQIVNLLTLAPGNPNEYVTSITTNARAAYITLTNSCNGISPTDYYAVEKLIELDLFPWGYREMEKDSREELISILCDVVTFNEKYMQDMKSSMDPLDSEL